MPSVILRSGGLLGWSRPMAATYEMKAPSMGHGVLELAALSALSALGCIVAAGRTDLMFVALFGAASTVAITETIRRLR